MATAKELLALPITDLTAGAEEYVTGGSMINQRFDNTTLVGWGMPTSWPVWNYDDAAYDVAPGVEVVASYPAQGDLLASGYLRDGDVLRGGANVFTTKVGKGRFVGYGSQVTFRSLPRSTFNLVYNALYGYPGEEVTAPQLEALESQFAPAPSTQ